MQKNSGFTLLELLIVVIIVGITASLVSLNIGAKPSSAKRAAHQLQSLLELARDDAIFKGQILGLKITSENYSFYRYQNKTWQPIADKLLRSYSLEPDLDYQLNLDNTKIDYTKASQPQIILLPDGSINNFTLLLQLKDRSETYQVFAQQSQIKIQLLENKK